MSSYKNTIDCITTEINDISMEEAHCKRLLEEAQAMYASRLADMEKKKQALEKERIEKKQLEQERIEREKLEQERLEKERVEKEKQDILDRHMEEIRREYPDLKNKQQEIIDKFKHIRHHPRRFEDNEVKKRALELLKKNNVYHLETGTYGKICYGQYRDYDVGYIIIMDIYGQCSYAPVCPDSTNLGYDYCNVLLCYILTNINNDFKPLVKKNTLDDIVKSGLFGILSLNKSVGCIASQKSINCIDIWTKKEEKRKSNENVITQTNKIFKDKYDAKIPITPDELEIIQKALLNDCLNFLSILALPVDGYGNKILGQYEKQFIRGFKRNAIVAISCNIENREGTYSSVAMCPPGGCMYGATSCKYQYKQINIKFYDISGKSVNCSVDNACSPCYKNKGGNISIDNLIKAILSPLSGTTVLTEPYYIDVPFDVIKESPVTFKLFSTYHSGILE